MYDHSDAGDPSSTWTISTPVAGISATALMVVSVASAIPIVGVYNPPNSGKRVVIQRAIAHQVTGTAVSYMWGVIQGASMTVTNSNARRHSTFAESSGIAASTFFNGTLAVVGTPVLFRPLGGSIAGATAIGAASKVEETYEGGDNIVAYPGTFIGIFADTNTGTAAQVRASLTITEITD